MPEGSADEGAGEAEAGALPGPGAPWVPLTEGDAPALQRFLEANPLYFNEVEGAPPGAGAALEILRDHPPPEMPFRQRWVLGALDAAHDWQALADVVSDLMAPGVWHIGLFIVATPLHGGGAAVALHAQLEAWARAHGAEWLRLGVVRGNARAERFWARCGYQESRVREGLVMGLRTQAVRVLVKPLTGRSWTEYWARVPRDRPDPG